MPISVGFSNWHDNCSDLCMLSVLYHIQRVLNISCKKTQNAMTGFCYLFISIRSVSTASDQPTPIKHNAYNVGILAVREDVSMDNRSLKTLNLHGLTAKETH